MKSIKPLKIVLILSTFLILLNGCNGKLPGGDARKFPADPAERVKQNLAEGRGFKLSEFGNTRGGVFEFASSNELWRASLDVIDFMPLSSVNYSGGVIITDWYSSEQNSNESVKISIRFLTNEIRSDALDINIFYKECSVDLSNCRVNKKNDDLVSQLALSILKKASQYEKERIENYKKENPYIVSTPTKEADKKKD